VNKQMTDIEIVRAFKAYIQHRFANPIVPSPATATAITEAWKKDAEWTAELQRRGITPVRMGEIAREGGFL